MPDDITDAAGASEVESEDDILTGDEDIIDEEEETEEETEEEEEEESDRDVRKADNEDDEDEEKRDREPRDKEDDEEEDEDSQNLEAQGNRPSYAQITQKYPEFFKTFPGAKDAFFRERDYARLFPTVDDAKEASERLQDFDFLESASSNGDPRPLISALKRSSDEVLGNFVENFAPALAKIDPIVWSEKVLKPTISNLLKTILVDSSQATDDAHKNLEKAVKIITKHLFGSYDIPEFKKTVDPNKSRFEQEKKQFFSAQRASFENAVDTALVGRVNKIASESVEGVDLPRFAKEALVERIIKQVGIVIERDQVHMAFMNSLWDKASRNGFTEEYKSRIQRAYLERFKQVLPVIRRKLLAQAKQRGTPVQTKTSNSARPSRQERVKPRPISSRPKSADEEQMDLLK